jgi:putative endonuclease
MFYTYIIVSLKDGSFYKGHTENLEERLEQHNSGKTKSIKHLIPFEMAYFETFSTRDEAIKREKYFKTAAGRRFIKFKLNLQP